MSVQNKYLLPLDQWALFIFYWAHRECRRSSRPLISRSMTRFHIRRHLLLANSLIQLLSHQTCRSLRQAHQPFQADGGRNGVAVRELSYSQSPSDSTYRNADTLSPFSLLNCLLMESHTIVILHTSHQTIL